MRRRHWLSGAIAFLLLMVPIAAAGAAELTGWRAGFNGAVTRFVLDLSDETAVQLHLAEDGKRLVLELGAEVPEGELRAGHPAGLISAVAFGREGALRISLQMKSAARILRHFLLPPSEGYRYRLVIDLEPAAPDAAARPPLRQAAPPAAPLSRRPAAQYQPAPSVPRPPPVSPPISLPEIAPPAAETALPPVPAVPPAARPAQRPLPIPARLGGTELGELRAGFDAAGAITNIDADGMLALLRPILVEEATARIETALRQPNTRVEDALKAAGVDFAYDPEQVEITLSIPLELRAVTVVDLASREPPLGGARIIPPADFSGYVNLRSGIDYIWPGRSFGISGRQPAVVDLDGALNLFGTVLEGLGSYHEGLPQPWSRGDFRIVHDLIDDRTRLTLGDLNYLSTGFQSFADAGGVAVSRNFDINPYATALSTGQASFELQRPSEVDVFVNGQRVRTLRLAPGRYNLRDFPFISGANNVSLRITDEVGRTREIAFPFIFDTALLAPGEHEFSYALGTASRFTPTGREYGGGTVFSAFHRFGVTDGWTLGTNAQGDGETRLLGIETRLGLPFGRLRLDGAASQSEKYGSGAGARLQYSYIEKPSEDGDDRSLSVSASWRSASFASLGAVAPVSPVALDVGFIYGQRIYKDLWGSVSFSTQRGRGTFPDLASYDLTLTERLGAGLQLDLSLGRGDRVTGGTDNHIMLSLSWFPQGSSQHLSTRYDSRDRSEQVSWSYSPLESLNAPWARIDAEHDAGGGRQVTAEVGRTSYRYETSIRHDDFVNGVDGTSEERTSLRFGTALAFAGGHFALSRPIDDSFLLVVPHASLDGLRVEANPRQGFNPESRTDWLGAAVIPDLPSYYLHNILIDVPNLPLNYDLGDQLWGFQPGYRSGAAVTIGSGPTVVVEGQLVDAAGAPVATVAGMARPLQGGEPIDFFTARTGRFRIGGLKPGKWILELPDVVAAGIPLTVPEDATGSIALGTIALPGGAAK